MTADVVAGPVYAQLDAQGRLQAID